MFPVVNEETMLVCLSFGASKLFDQTEERGDDDGSLQSLPKDDEENGYGENVLAHSFKTREREGEKTRGYQISEFIVLLMRHLPD